MSAPSRAHSRTLARGLVVALALGMPRAALADEDEWFFGGGVDYVNLATPSADDAEAPASVLHGAALALRTRYGPTDVFDLAATASVAALPGADALALEGTVGALYVIDTFQFVPTLGADAGLFAALPLACEAEPCGAAVRISVGAPVALEWRATDAFAVGIRARYGFLLGGATVSTKLDAGLTAALTL